VNRQGTDILFICGRIFEKKSGADLRYQTEHEEMREQNTQWSGRTGCSNGIDERMREYDVTLVWYRSWVYVTRVSTSRRSPSAVSNDVGGDSCITQRTYTAVLFSLRFVRYTTTATLSVPPGVEHNITTHSVLMKFYKYFIKVSVLFIQNI
jgi:hypothetical protein